MEVQQEKQAYRQVFNSTFIFGGLQVFTILIAIIRTKIVAVILGASGYGFQGLLTANLGFITFLTGLGVDFSAVRDISIANEAGDQVKLSTTLKTFRRWVWFTGLLGMLTVIVLSPWLSQLSFKHKNYTWAFLLISVTLLITAISNGQAAILRGMRKINDIAKAGIWGSALGLVTSIPLYYFYGFYGIVPALIISSITGLFLSWHFSRKVKTIPVQISYKDSFIQGKGMAKLGIMLTLHLLIGSGVTFIVNAFISNMGGLSQAGLYNAGWNITSQYVGLIFTAMIMDFFPRLAGVHSNKLKVEEMVNQQSEIAILIIAPILLLFLTVLPILIPLFFTKEFLPIIPYIQWMILGMLFKTASWPMGFIALAKGDSKFYFWFESILGNILLLFSCIAGYYFFRLEGMGIAFLANFIVYFLLITFMCRKKFNVTFTNTFLNLFIIQLSLSLIAFLVVYFFKYPTGYISGGILLIISSLYSYKELNKRIDIKDFLLSKIKKNNMN